MSIDKAAYDLYVIGNRLYQMGDVFTAHSNSMCNAASERSTMENRILRIQNTRQKVSKMMKDYREVEEQMREVLKELYNE